MLSQVHICLLFCIGTGWAYGIFLSLALFTLLFPCRKLCRLYTAAGNTCSILAVCYGMGYVGSWTLWSLWVPSKWRHSVVYGNKSGADAESGSVYLGMFEMVPLSDCFSVPPCKCCPCCRMVSGGELAAFWCNSQLGCSDTGATPCSHPSCSCGTSWTTTDDSFLFGSRVDNQGLAEKPLSSLKLHPQGWILTLSKAHPFFTSCQIRFHTSTWPSWLIWPLKLSQ